MGAASIAAELAFVALHRHVNLRLIVSVLWRGGFDLKRLLAIVALHVANVL
jgi:hypothetical protein